MVIVVTVDAVVVVFEFLYCLFVLLLLCVFFCYRQSQSKVAQHVARVSSTSGCDQRSIVELALSVPWRGLAAYRQNLPSTT